MNSDFATVTATGILTKEPRTVEGYTDASCLNTNIAINRIVLDLNNTPKIKTTFIDCSYWFKPEDTSVLDLKKGDRVEVQAELHQDSWEPEPGQKRYRHFLKLKTIKKVEK